MEVNSALVYNVVTCLTSCCLRSPIFFIPIFPLIIPLRMSFKYFSDTPKARPGVVGIVHLGIDHQLPIRLEYHLAQG